MFSKFAFIRFFSVRGNRCVYREGVWFLFSLFGKLGICIGIGIRYFDFIIGFVRVIES